MPTYELFAVPKPLEVSIKVRHSKNEVIEPARATAPLISSCNFLLLF
jgi:hypothetical protein